MSIERGERRAGSNAVRLDDGTLVPAGPDTSRWVTVPGDVPGLAGQRIAVERVEDAACPACQQRAREGEYTVAEAERDGLHAAGGATRYVLAPTPVPGRPGRVLGVIECPAHGFLWLAEAAAPATPAGEAP
jgi:hypothetical protein